MPRFNGVWVNGSGEPSAIVSNSDGTNIAAASETAIGAVTETAPATDTASSGLNGRLQRIAQRLTSLIALLPTALSASGGLKASLDRISGAAVTLTIANGATASDSVDARAYSMFGLVMPAAFTGTSLSFTVSYDNSNFQALYDSANVQVTMTVAAARNYDLPAELASWPYWKAVSGSAEGAARSLILVMKG